MKILFSLLLAGLLLLVPTLSIAQDVTITDWRGKSATFTEGSVDSDGVTVVYHTAGEGPLVLFVHSISGPWFDFRHQMVMLSERYHVVSMSTRGTDKSDKPVGVEHYASARIADDLVAIIDAFGEETATVIGQDSGGLHAWNFAYTYPERTAGLISLGSIHPAGLIRELIDNPDQQQASTFQRGMQENADAGKAYGERLTNRRPNPNEPPELARLRQEAYARTDPESIVGFYKANWPWSPVTMETEAFGHKFGEFPAGDGPHAVHLRGRQRALQESDAERYVGVGRGPLDDPHPSGRRPRTAYPGAGVRDAPDHGMARDRSIGRTRR